MFLYVPLPVRSPPLDFIIAADDIIYFAGELNAIEFVGEEHGLALVTQEVEERFKEAEPSQAFSEYGAAPYTKLIRLTVKKGSDLIGQHVRNVNLRSRFNMTLVAIKRTSSRPDVSLSDTVLSEGDMLIADVGECACAHVRCAWHLYGLLWRVPCTPGLVVLYSLCMCIGIGALF